MALVFAGALPQLPAAGVIGAVGQLELQFLDKRLVQRPPLPERAEEQFVGLFRVADFKQSAQVAGIGGHAVMLENLPRVVVGDILIFQFPGVVGERNAVAVQGLGQLRIRGDVLALP